MRMEDEMLIEDDELELLEGEEKPDGDQELYEHLRDRGRPRTGPLAY